MVFDKRRMLLPGGKYGEFYKKEKKIWMIGYLGNVDFIAVAARPI